MKLVALIQVRDEEHLLPGWLENVADAVDGIVALDDGSRDATPEILRGHPKLIELLQNPPGQPWDERANQTALVRAGRRHGAEWLLCLDADERLEQGFAERAPALIEAAERDGIGVYCFQLRELWDDPLHYRVDGIWGRKTPYRLFRNDPSHTRFDPRKLHRFWMPLELAGRLAQIGRHSGENLYHLRMITPEGRAARAARYEALDPDRVYQREGYAYLTAEEGLSVEKILEGRGYSPKFVPT